MPYYGGIDVSKQTLTAATFPHTELLTVPNTPSGWHTLLTRWQSLALRQVVVESSGGYEQGVVQALQQAGVPVVVVPPQRARYFARSLRPALKTDAVDATLLARFASVYEPPAAPAPRAAQATLKALWGRREQVVRMLEAERKRLATAGHPLVQASLARVIERLEAELAALEAALAEVEASDAELAARGALVRSMVGIGQVAAWGLLAELPELGRVSRQAIAALAGLAPMAWESGGRVGVRRVRGGRGRVRRVLYVAAVVAVRCEGRWREVYERLLARGLKPKAALCAVARRLVVVLNAMVREGRCYERV